jgi:hypothetical protein
MKKILFIAFVAFTINAKAQITLEHAYDSASTAAGTGYQQDQLMIIHFEVSGDRYVKVNRTGACISIYDMNHSLLKSISLAGLPNFTNDPTGSSILYISENLFSTDSKIAFMYGTTSIPPSNTYYTGIYNEDGTLLFSDTGVAMIRGNFEQQQLPIYNTSVGTKMILSYKNGQAKVFSLPGTLSQSIQEENNVLIAAQSSVSNPYPNPNNGSTQIDYTFPPGVNEGEIVFYDLQGMEVKRFKVDKIFNTLLISTKDIAAGTYYYQLQTSSQNSGGKKMVVIK